MGTTRLITLIRYPGKQCWQHIHMQPQLLLTRTNQARHKSEPLVSLKVNMLEKCLLANLHQPNQIAHPAHPLLQEEMDSAEDLLQEEEVEAILVEVLLPIGIEEEVIPQELVEDSVSVLTNPCVNVTLL